GRGAPRPPRALSVRRQAPDRPRRRRRGGPAVTARPALALALAGLVSLFALSAVAAWPDWLPDLPDRPEWGQDWELADLEHSLALHPPVEVERWLYNPRERTARGLERMEGQGPDAALSAFEAAARLAPGDRR